MDQIGPTHPATHPTPQTKLMDSKGHLLPAMDHMGHTHLNTTIHLRPIHTTHPTSLVKLMDAMGHLLTTMGHTHLANTHLTNQLLESGIVPL